MWPDNETDLDFLNFSGIADTIAEIIVSANGRPISIGLAGAWGSGKSSLIKLTRASLASASAEASKPFVFVEFNAWLYQGYDDARAALMEAIATTLQREAESRKKGLDKVKDLLKRVNWLRAAKLTAGSALALSLGLPPVGIIGEVWRLGKTVTGSAGTVDSATLQATGEQALADAESLFNAPADASPPKEISALRESFQAALNDMGITLVVLIDDLDRCLPETTISTLEAIRLFLFLENAAFVVAADDEMIKAAVRKHFEGINDEQVISYFDKLIQVPIRVPALGTQEVRAYMMLLYMENSDVPEAMRLDIRKKVAAQLRQSWQGKRVDRAFMESLYSEYPPELISRFNSAERLAPIMVSATNISGNPRLIKRFLNALAIRMTISRAQGVGVDEAVLAKMLLFERIESPAAYARLMAAVSASEDGKPVFLAKWEEDLAAGKEVKLDPPWNGPFVLEWLALPPKLADVDLRGALYVSREHAPLITTEDRLSSEALELLGALVDHPEASTSLKDRLTTLPPNETDILMDRLLERAGREQDWGVPAILDALLTLIAADEKQGKRLAAFLLERPTVQIQPSIVPKLSSEPWTKPVFEHWRKNASATVKAAISQLVQA